MTMMATAATTTCISRHEHTLDPYAFVEHNWRCTHCATGSSSASSLFLVGLSFGAVGEVVDLGYHGVNLCFHQLVYKASLCFLSRPAGLQKIRLQYCTAKS